MADCLFCKIVSGDLPAGKVAESDGALAFRDINPEAPTHILVIPKEHVASAAELGGSSGDVLAEIFTMIVGLAEKEGLQGGWRVVTNVGSDAGQSVHHLHFHLLGGRTMAWPPG